VVLRSGVSGFEKNEKVGKDEDEKSGSKYYSKQLRLFKIK